MSQRVEAASAAILKEELISLEEWIANEQKAIADQVKSIYAAHDAVKSTLEGTGSFSSEEVAQQLSAIEERATQRQAVHDSYGVLL